MLLEPARSFINEYRLTSPHADTIGAYMKTKILIQLNRYPVSRTSTIEKYLAATKIPIIDVFKAWQDRGVLTSDFRESISLSLIHLMVYMSEEPIKCIEHCNCVTGHKCT